MLWFGWRKGNWPLLHSGGDGAEPKRRGRGTAGFGHRPKRRGRGTAGFGHRPNLVGECPRVLVSSPNVVGEEPRILAIPQTLRARSRAVLVTLWARSRGFWTPMKVRQEQGRLRFWATTSLPTPRRLRVCVCPCVMCVCSRLVFCCWSGIRS